MSLWGCEMTTDVKCECRYQGLCSCDLCAPEPADRTILRWMPTEYMEAARAAQGMPDALAVVEGRAVEAAGLARQAVLAWLDLGAERASAGFLLDLHTLALPNSGHDLAAGLPDLLVEAERVKVLQAAAAAGAMMGVAVALAEEALRQHEAPEPVEDGAWIVTVADLRETRRGKRIGNIGPVYDFEEVP